MEKNILSINATQKIKDFIKNNIVDEKKNDNKNVDIHIYNIINANQKYGCYQS